MNTPVLGQPAPDFALPATATKTVRLADLRGHIVVLYFYPKDNTPGCTQEAQDFRDYAAKFDALDTIVLGVSRDGLRSHEGFRAKESLPFDLLSDADSAICRAYDVKEVERSTFLIDRDGVLQREWRQVKVTGHVQEVLKALNVEE